MPSEMYYLAKCPDCTPPNVIRKFYTFDSRDAWLGPHIDITHHKVEVWEITDEAG